MTPSQLGADAVLELSEVSKRFAAIVALDKIDFAVRSGEIHALLGQNGAGKSTLIKIITGALQPDTGRLSLRGRPVMFLGPRDASSSGITALPQDVIAVPHLSVGRNVLLGIESWRAQVDRLAPDEAERAQWALRQVGATFSLTAKAGELSATELRLLQIARTMLNVGDIIVMDEPTAVLSEPEAENLLRHLVSFRNHGKAIVYVTHRLSEVVKVADRATILRDGRRVGQLEGSALNRRRILELMAGPHPEQRELPGTTSPPLLSTPIVDSRNRALDVVNLSARSRFSAVSFSASTGQILGLAGVQGSGNAEILRALAGLEPWTSGNVKAFGRTLRSGSISSAFEQGMMLVPADRRNGAILSQMSIQENLAASRRVRSSCRRFGVRSLKHEREMARDHIQTFSVVPAKVQALAGILSGGNQQKIALARILESDAKIFLLEEPTQGIDVRSKYEIHDLLRNHANHGRTIIIASSEFEELIALADVIHVMRLGRLHKTFAAGAADYREILHWALP